MDTLKLHSHFENLLYVGRSVLTNTSSRIQRLFFKKEMCISLIPQHFDLTLFISS